MKKLILIATALLAYGFVYAQSADYFLKNGDLFLSKNGSAAIFIIPLVLGFSYWIFKKLGGRFNGDIGLSDEVINSFDDIFKDKALVNDLASILSKEGDLDKLFDKLYKVNKDVKFPPSKWVEWFSLDTEKNYKYQPDAKSIAIKLIQKPSYKNFSKKHDFNKNDDIKMEKLFYFILTQKEFKGIAKNFIMKAIDKNYNLISKEKPPVAIKLRDLIPNNYV
jgi:hypothetical protein